MAQRNLLDVKHIIFNSLEADNIGRALAQIKILARPEHNEAVAAVEEPYKMMLSYKFRGYEDPDADLVFKRLMRDAYELVDTVCCSYFPADTAQNEAFDVVWNKGQAHLNSALAARVDDIKDVGAPLQTQLLASAFTISCLRSLDEEKMRYLLDLCSHPDAKTAARALTGLILCLIAHFRRISLYPELTNELNQRFNNEESLKLAKQIVKHFIRCSESQKLAKDIKENILPALGKLAPDMHKKLKENFDSDDYEEKAYDLQNMILESGIADKMEAYGELQQQGSDINYSTFSALKKFGFFQNIDNWFMPFYAENPVLEPLVAEEDGKAFVDFLASSSFLSDSDKYSFCVNLLMVNPQMRKPMEMQFKTEAEGAPKADEDMVAYTNRYVQDLYRFFKLFRNKDFYDDIFQMRCDVYNMDFFRFIDPDGTFLNELADFYLSKELYDAALGAYKIMEETSGPDAKLYRRMAFCMQKCKFYTAAAEYYHKVEIMDDADAALFKSMAYCYRMAEDKKTALEYYKKAEAMDPENLNIMFNIACCLADMKDYEKALNYFYKIDFVNPDAKRSPKYHLYYAHCLWATGNVKDAVQHYALFLPSDKLEENLRLAPNCFSDREIAFILDYIRYFISYSEPSQ